MLQSTKASIQSFKHGFQYLGNTRQTWSQPHQTMWQPEHKATLPSPGDFKHAKKAIDELEDALKDALAMLEQAQSRVLALTKELDERKAWIAPVRKLPSELLSEIFIFGSEMEHLAPVTITEVSRLWRAIVLTTPRAWSLIYISAPEHDHHLNQYVSTFFERSNPWLLHIWIRDDLDYETDSDDFEFEPPADRVLPLLLSSLSRIRCLSIGSRQLRTLSEECMLNLARLTITDLAYDIPPFFINHDQFPRLRSILSTGCSWGDSMSLTSFPPLQELSVQVTHLPTWLDVVNNCSTTLKALVLLGHLRWTERVTIIFPRLKSLTLIEWSDSPEAAEWLITMVTPGLISYKEFTATGSTSGPRHGDVKSVTHLQNTHVPDLALYASLRVLQLSPAYPSTYVLCAKKLAEQLEQDNQCPALELTEFHVSMLSEKDTETESIKRGIIERMRRARPGTDVLFTKTFSPMPGSLDESPCGFDMPCSPDKAYLEDE